MNRQRNTKAATLSGLLSILPAHALAWDTVETSIRMLNQTIGSGIIALAKAQDPLASEPWLGRVANQTRAGAEADEWRGPRVPSPRGRSPGERPWCAIEERKGPPAGARSTRKVRVFLRLVALLIFVS